MWVWLAVCFHVALRWAGNLSRVDPAQGMLQQTPVTLSSVTSQCGKWMDGLIKTSSFICAARSCSRQGESNDWTSAFAITLDCLLINKLVFCCIVVQGGSDLLRWLETIKALYCLFAWLSKPGNWWTNSKKLFLLSRVFVLHLLRWKLPSVELWFDGWDWRGGDPVDATCSLSDRRRESELVAALLGPMGNTDMWLCHDLHFTSVGKLGKLAWGEICDALLVRERKKNLEQTRRNLAQSVSLGCLREFSGIILQPGGEKKLSNPKLSQVSMLSFDIFKWPTWTAAFWFRGASCMTSSSQGRRMLRLQFLNHAHCKWKIPPTACIESLSVDLLMFSHVYLPFVLRWINLFQLCDSSCSTVCHTRSHSHIFSTVSLYSAILHADCRAIIRQTPTYPSVLQLNSSPLQWNWSDEQNWIESIFDRL